MVEAALRPQPQDVPRLIGKSRPLERAGRDEQQPAEEGDVASGKGPWDVDPPTSKEEQAAKAWEAEAAKAETAAAATAAAVVSRVCSRLESPGLPLGFVGGHDYDQIRCYSKCTF